MNLFSQTIIILVGQVYKNDLRHTQLIMAAKRSNIMRRGVLDEKLIYEILSAVEEIPRGSVSTYGQIAKLIGRDKNSRLVGKVLSMSEYYGDYPCHRVVNHAGRLVPGWLCQRELLMEEGVTFKDADHVDIKKCLWTI